jgi:hypothetical protein
VHERSCTVRSKPKRRRVLSIQSSIAKVLEHLQDKEQGRGHQGGGTEQNDESGQDILQNECPCFAADDALRKRRDSGDRHGGPIQDGAVKPANRQC